MKNEKVIFLDRDGVINENRDNDYIKEWDEFKFLPKAKEAIRTLTDASWGIIIITNQAGVGKGIMSDQAVRDINARMIEEIEAYGGKIKTVYYCPHRPEEDCECRKPKPGMLFNAAREFNIEFSESYLIGDNITDIKCGSQVGCTTILVKTGLGSEHIERRSQWPVEPDYIASDLSEAVEFILIQR
ncbi:D-glycero-beta-D-manno-heptose 1,7-bisphosphate 7-phosphatase [Candidatus Poribacteria bacterium]